MSAEQYPYDPKLKRADMARADGLERLRWIPDRGLAQSLYDIYQGCNEKKRIAWCDSFDRRKNEERRQQLIRIGESAMRGDFGEDAMGIASSYFNRNIGNADLARCEEFLKDLQRLDLDVHSMPCRRGSGRRRFSDE